MYCCHLSNFPSRFIIKFPSRSLKLLSRVFYIILATSLIFLLNWNCHFSSYNFQSPYINFQSILILQVLFLYLFFCWFFILLFIKISMFPSLFIKLRIMSIIINGFFLVFMICPNLLVAISVIYFLKTVIFFQHRILILCFLLATNLFRYQYPLQVSLALFHPPIVLN